MNQKIISGTGKIKNAVPSSRDGKLPQKSNSEAWNNVWIVPGLSIDWQSGIIFTQHIFPVLGSFFLYHCCNLCVDEKVGFVEGVKEGIHLEVEVRRENK